MTTARQTQVNETESFLLLNVWLFSWGWFQYLEAIPQFVFQGPQEPPSSEGSAEGSLWGYQTGRALFWCSAILCSNLSTTGRLSWAMFRYSQGSVESNMVKCFHCPNNKNKDKTKRKEKKRKKNRKQEKIYNNEERKYVRNSKTKRVVVLLRISWVSKWHKLFLSVEAGTPLGNSYNDVIKSR